MVVDKTEWFEVWRNEINYTNNFERAYDTVIAIDCSGSMNINDKNFEYTVRNTLYPGSSYKEITCYRKLASKNYIKAQKSNDKTGVVLFASAASIACALTNDETDLLRAVDRIYSSGGTNLDDVGRILMKRVVVVVILTICMVINCGCAAVEVIEREVNNQNSANNISDKIIQYINDDDTGEIEKLFCEYDQNKEDFIDEVEALVDCFEGEIVSYDIKYKGETEVSIRDGEIESQMDEIHIKNIVCGTNTEEKYKLIIRRYVTNTEDKTKEGIIAIQLRDSDEKIVSTVDRN